jgi:hypothetical protein
LKCVFDKMVIDQEKFIVNSVYMKSNKVWTIVQVLATWSLKNWAILWKRKDLLSFTKIWMVW